MEETIAFHRMAVVVTGKYGNHRTMKGMGKSCYDERRTNHGTLMIMAESSEQQDKPQSTISKSRNCGGWGIGRAWN